MSKEISVYDEYLIFQALQQRRKNQFGNTAPAPEYWRLSDLSMLYPDVFDTKHPISKSDIIKMNQTIVDAIPEFKDLEETPLHVINSKETYSVYFPATNTIKTIKNGANQHLTRVACEYLFRQKQGYYFQQAYFMHPNKTIDELKATMNDIAFEQVRSHLANTSNLLSAIINRAYGAKKTSFAEIWSKLWCTVYNVKDMQTLNDMYNLKSSPINYMHPRTFNLIISMLQEIETRFCNKMYYSINEIFESVYNIGLFTRAKFTRYGMQPEDELNIQDSYKIVEKVRKERQNFWKQYYPISLQQR